MEPQSSVHRVSTSHDQSNVNSILVLTLRVVLHHQIKLGRFVQAIHTLIQHQLKFANLWTIVPWWAKKFYSLINRHCQDLRNIFCFILDLQRLTICSGFLYTHHKWHRHREETASQSLPCPSPWQASHRPPLTLKPNLPAVYPRACRSFVLTKIRFGWGQIILYTLLDYFVVFSQSDFDRWEKLAELLDESSLSPIVPNESCVVYPSCLARLR